MQRLLREAFFGMSEKAVARVSKECIEANKSVFGSSKALSAFAVAPRSKKASGAVVDPKVEMAARLLWCWGEKRGANGEAGVDGLIAWMRRTPTPTVSRP